MTLLDQLNEIMGTDYKDIDDISRHLLLCCLASLLMAIAAARR